MMTYADLKEHLINIDHDSDILIKSQSDQTCPHQKFICQETGAIIAAKDLQTHPSLFQNFLMLMREKESFKNQIYVADNLDTINKVHELFQTEPKGTNGLVIDKKVLDIWHKRKRLNCKKLIEDGILYLQKDELQPSLPNNPLMQYTGVNKGHGKYNFQGQS